MNKNIGGEYDLAGQVKLDSLYVGYLDQYGLKGKLTLPSLSTLGEIVDTETIGNCGVFKHENGTVIIDKPVYDLTLPNRKTSLLLGVSKNGLEFANDPSKPTPIKTLNNNGLQKFKETDDYIIYLDKDAVIEDGIPVHFEALFEVNKKDGVVSTTDINLSIEIGANNIGQEFPELESKFESLILGKITIQTKKEVSMDVTNVGQENAELGGSNV